MGAPEIQAFLYRTTMLKACAPLIRDLTDFERQRYVIADQAPICATP